MLNLPLFVFLVLYIIFALATLFFFLFGMYHIAAAGEFSLSSFIMTIITGGGVLIVLSLTIITLSRSSIDWTAPFSFFENNWINQPDSFE